MGAGTGGHRARHRDQSGPRFSDADHGPHFYNTPQSIICTEQRPAHPRRRRHAPPRRHARGHVPRRDARLGLVEALEGPLEPALPPALWRLDRGARWVWQLAGGLCSTDRGVPLGVVYEFRRFLHQNESSRENPLTSIQK